VRAARHPIVAKTHRIVAKPRRMAAVRAATHPDRDEDTADRDAA
jgi:hypothetical protein